MRELRHPLTMGEYGIDPATGLVRVRENGMTGLFTYTGVWQSGDRFAADPEMCNWVGGPGGDAGFTKNYKTL